MGQRFIIFLIIQLITTDLIGQSFDKYKDSSNKCNVIRYYKIDHQFVIEKRIPYDTLLNAYYVVGIYINNMKFTFIDSFMRTGGSLVFESGKRLDFLSEHSITDFERGFAAVRHQLKMDEFELLSTEMMSHFIVIGERKEFDKYERKNILEAIQKLKTEQF